MNTESLQTLALKFAEAINTKNIDLFDAFIAPDYVNHNPTVAQGLAGAKEFFIGWLAAFPDTQVLVEDSLTTGDKVVGRYTYTATHTGTFMGIPATGNRITMRSIDIWCVRDGMFIEHWDELNTLEVFQQLGVIPLLSQ